jgi:hypothetical protein
VSYLPTWLRASLRTSTNRWLKDTCKIEQSSVSIGELGDAIETWAVVSAATACRVIRTNSGTRNLEGQETMTDTPTIVCPAGTAFATGQRITVSSTGFVYHVTGLETDMTDELFTAATVARQR